MNIYQLMPRFRALFAGLEGAYGTGRGQWIRRQPTADTWINHLLGRGPGIGIAPLRPDSRVLFAAIDLDEPDFDAAREMQTYLPGTTWLERSRSGNAHVWALFSEPIEAWIPMGIMREATAAAGKPRVEVFPKNHDFTRVRVGSYINLPFHGVERPILSYTIPGNAAINNSVQPSLEDFISTAEEYLNDPEIWRKRAAWLLIGPPESRERTTEFGKQQHLHMCADYVLEHAEDNPVGVGHRAVVYFCLARMLTNWEHCDSEEALDFMRGVNQSSPDPISDSELRRILGNAERGGFTSTGCDDPLFAPYAHPRCPIANPGGN